MSNQNKPQGTTNQTSGTDAPINQASASPASSVTPPKEDKKDSTKVEVEVSVLEELLRKVKDLEDGQRQLEQTAPQDQIRKIEALRASGKLVKSVKIRKYDNKLVTGWKMIKDNVWVADGKLNEEQIFAVYFEDGNSTEVNQINFTRGTLYEPFEVVAEGKTANGDVEFTVMLENGKKLVINSKYVN